MAPTTTTTTWWSTSTYQRPEAEQQRDSAVEDGGGCQERMAVEDQQLSGSCRRAHVGCGNKWAKNAKSVAADKQLGLDVVEDNSSKQTEEWRHANGWQGRLVAKEWQGDNDGCLERTAVKEQYGMEQRRRRDYTWGAEAEAHHQTCDISFWKSCHRCTVPLEEREQTSGEGWHATGKARSAMHHHGFERIWGQGMFVVCKGHLTIYPSVSM